MTVPNTDRKLTPLVRYVTLRLYGYPFFGYLWFIWLSCVFFLVSMHGARPVDPEYGETRLIATIAGFGVFIGLCRVGFLLATKSGRRWLFGSYSDNGEGVSVSSLVLVRAIPFIALAALIQFFL